MVSKLNVKPFHKVNSPELAPVTNRLPSGVHAKVNMGQRILLVAVLTNLVVTAFEGLSKYADGGNNSGTYILSGCKAKRSL